MQDAVELETCPTIEVVFLMDTSDSNILEVGTMCDEIEAALSELATRGFAVSAETLVMAFGGGVCRCCDPTVAVWMRYGSTAVGHPEIPILGSCTGGSGDVEDWGPATAVVAANTIKSRHTNFLATLAIPVLHGYSRS